MSKNSKPKVKASTATSAFNGSNTFNYGLGGFGSSTSSKGADGSINTNASLSPQMQGLYNGATQGLSNNQQFINMTPTQQLQDLQAGHNNYYNLNSEMNRIQQAKDLAAAQSRFSASGMDNSTAMGGYQAQLASNNLLTDLATRQAALDYQNQTAAQNMGLNAQLLDQLYGYVSPAAQQSNNNLYQAFGNQDQMGMFNAQQRQQAAQQNAQLAMQQQQMRSQFWGNMINAGAQLGAAAMTGGTSSLAAAAGSGLSRFLRGVKTGG